MNRILSIVMIPVIAAVVALAGFGVAYAQTSSSTDLQVKGTISAINPAALPAPTVAITPDEGSPVVVNVVPGTVITKEGTGTITLSSLAIGNRVVAVYDKLAMNASKITVKVPAEEHEALVGTIKSMGPSSFILTTKHQGDVTINVNGSTIYRVPGVNDATLAGLRVGDRVAVLATQANGGNLALHVNLVPGKALGLSKDKDDQGSPANSQHMGIGEKGEQPAAGMAHGKSDRGPEAK